MGSRQKQRTKGNVRPSSSGQAAELLAKEGGGTLNFVGFGALSGDLGYVSVKDEMDGDLDNDLRMTLRKINKKDVVTKLKAIQDFGVYCTSKEEKDVIGALPHFPRLYNKLALDPDRRVREATQLSFEKLILTVGRNLAPNLRALMGSWLLCQCDPYAPAASAARVAFQKAFPTQEKQRGSVGFCKNEVLAFIEMNLFKETAESLSDPMVLSPEEQEERYMEVMASTLQALGLFMELLPEREHAATEAALAAILDEGKFWKLSKHKSPMVRGAVCTVLRATCEYLPHLAEKQLQKISSTLLSAIDETEPVLTGALWDAVLILVSKFKECWSHVNIRKTVLPKLWSLLRHAGKGMATAIYPNLLPLLSHLPEETTEDQLGFFKIFFENMREGFTDDSLHKSKSQETAVYKAFLECLRFAVSQCLKSSDPLRDVLHLLLNSELQLLLSATFSSSLRKTTLETIYSQTSILLRYLNDQSDNSEFPQKQDVISECTSVFWSVLTSTCSSILEEDNPSNEYIQNVAALLAELNCPGKSRCIFAKSRNLSFGKRSRVSFGKSVSFGKEDVILNKEDFVTGYSETEKVESKEFQEVNDTKGRAITCNKEFEEFLRQILEVNWTCLGVKEFSCEHLRFLSNILEGFSCSTEIFDALLSARRKVSTSESCDIEEMEQKMTELRLEGESSESNLTMSSDNPSTEKQSQDSKLGQASPERFFVEIVMPLINSAKARSEVSVRSGDEVIQLLFELVLEVVGACDAKDQVGLLDQFVVELGGLDLPVLFIKKIKNNSYVSLRKSWIKDGNFGNTLVKLTQELCRQSIEEPAVLSKDSWEVVTMAFSTDDCDEPLCDSKYAEKILVTVYETLQIASQDLQLPTTRTVAVNFICDVAVSFFANIKSCITLPSAEDLLLALFQLSCRQDLQLSEPLMKKVMSSWTTGAGGLIQYTSGYLKEGGFFHRAADWIKMSVFDKRPSFESLQNLAGVTSVLCCTILNNLPSDADSEDNNSCNEILSEFVSMVLPREEEIVEFSSCINDKTLQYLFTSNLLNFDPETLITSDLTVMPQYLSYALFIAHMIGSFQSDEENRSLVSSATTSPLGQNPFTQEQQLTWLLHQVNALAWCQAAMGCETTSKLPLVEALPVTVPKYCHHTASVLDDAVSKNLAGLSCEQWKSLITSAISSCCHGDVLHFASLSRVLTDYSNKIHSSRRADLLSLAGGFDRFAPTSDKDTNLLEVIIPFLSEPKILDFLEFYVAVLMSISPSQATASQGGLGCLRILVKCIEALSSLDSDKAKTLCKAVVCHVIDIREVEEDLFLFSSNLSEAPDPVIQFVLNVIHLLTCILQAAPSILLPPQWDFVMCSLVSWIETSCDSLKFPSERCVANTFHLAVCNLLSMVASMIESVSVEGTITDLPPNLYTEWKEFFSQGAFDSLLPKFVQLMGSTDFNKLAIQDWLCILSLCDAVSHVPADQVIGHKLSHRLIPDFPLCINDELQTVLNTMVGLMKMSHRGVAIAAYNVLLRLMPCIAESYSSASSEEAETLQETEDEDENIPPPPPLKEQMETLGAFLGVILEDVDPGECVSIDPGTEAFHHTLAYLLHWKLYMTMFGAASAEARAKFAANLKKTDSLSKLMVILFKLMPDNPVLVVQGKSPIKSGKSPGKGQLTMFTEEPLLHCRDIYSSSKEIAHLACSVYHQAMKDLPAMVRQFWSSQDKRLAKYVDDYTTIYVSPLLTTQELHSVQASKKKLENFTIVTRTATREVIATYTMQDLSIELVILLPVNHPLGVISVESGKKIGVSTAQWRNWMLQLTTYLNNQNGTILDGLQLWRQNVDKRFDGVEECTVCYSVIHGANCSLPKISCRTCKKKFHSACLYKWFKSSNLSTCPLCRSPF